MPAHEAVFPADQFCNNRPVWHRLGGDETVPESLRSLSRHYPDLGEIREVFEPVPRAIHGQVLQVVTDGATVVLKGVSQGRGISVAALDAHLGLVEELRRDQGVALPLVLPTASGAHAWAEGAHSYYVMRHEGNGAAFADDRTDGLDRIAHDIGVLFAALKNVPRSRLLFSERRLLGHETLDARGALQRAVGGLDASVQSAVGQFDEVVDAWQGKYRADIVLAGCHSDLHPHNVLVRNARQTCFLDLESIRPAHRVASLGFAVFKLLRNAIARRGRTSAAAISQLRGRFVDRLTSAGGLTSDEARGLALGARAENLHRLLTIFTSPQNQSRWGDRAAMFGRALSGEIDVIFGPGGARP